LFYIVTLHRKDVWPISLSPNVYEKNTVDKAKKIKRD